MVSLRAMSTKSADPVIEGDNVEIFLYLEDERFQICLRISLL